jgi:CHAT domain-containing protein/tetratricopeptide (TPR) repeat protein
MEEVTGPKSWLPRSGRLRATLLLAAAAVGVSALGVVVASARRTDDAALERLATAVGPHRLTRARLTGGFAYAPCDTAMPNDSLVAGLVCRRDLPNQWLSVREVTRLATTMRGAVARDAMSSSGLHASAVWHVVWAKPDTAIEELRAAAQLRPADARIQNDLAVALLARAEGQQDARSILDAYSAVDSAVTLAPRLPEARFNRALILERLNLRGDAITEWSAFLQLDDRTQWAVEARQYLRGLRVPAPDWQTVQPKLDAAVVAGEDSVVRRIATMFPGRLTEAARLTTLDWARSLQDGQPRADSLLPRAFGIARGLASATGDSLWHDVVRALIESSERKDQARLNAAARGFIAYDVGQAYLESLKGDSARPWLVEASRQFAAANNAARFLSDFGLARVSYLRPNSAEAIAAFRRVTQTTPNAYRRIRGRAIRTEGVVQGVEANFHASIDAFLAAIREGEGTGDPGLDLQPRTNLALDYASLGSDEAAWRHLYAGLRSATRYPDVDADVRLVFLVAAHLSARTHPRIASLFQREAVRLAGLSTTSRGDSLRLVSALERQAELFGRAGQSEQALETVRAARAYLARLETDSVTASFGADIDLVEGLAWLRVRPDSAVRILRRVVDRYRATRYRMEVDRALLLLANAYAATGAMDSAQRAFAEAIAETERRRSGITSAEDRARFLDLARPIIDQHVTFLIDRGDSLSALEFIERMRGRVLLERTNSAAHDTDTSERIVDRVRSILPAGTSIVSYAVLPRELVAWLITRDGVSMYRTRDVVELERLTSHFSTLVQSRSSTPEIRAAAGQLHRVLLSPFASKLTAGSTLIVIPDKWLHFVPFAALFDDSTRTFAIERLQIGIAPSVQLYAQSVSRYQQLWAKTAPSVLAVGNPAFEARMFPLPPLPGAEVEATTVASFYPNARVLIGRSATKRAFLTEMATSNVVHFAGHGVVRTDAPLSSYLVLAPDGDSEASSTLTAQDLSGVRLSKTRLAILSGCQTAGGRISDTEGASSLARALFGAGVPAVVASLWAVDDRATAEFFTAYHRRLSQGEDPTAALRLTQKEWLTRTSDPWQSVSTWAAFALFGATSNERTSAVGVARSQE